MTKLYTSIVLPRAVYILSSTSNMLTLYSGVAKEKIMHFGLKAWNLAHLYNIPYWLFLDMDPSQKHPLVTVVAIFYFL